MLRKWHTLCRNCTSNLEFGSFPGLTIWGTILSGDAGQGSSWSAAQAQGWTTLHFDHSYPHSRCFSLSVQYSINRARYLTLYYKTGFVLEDLAQLQATTSLWSRLRWARLSYMPCRLGVENALLTDCIFNLRWVYRDVAPGQSREIWGATQLTSPNKTMSPNKTIPLNLTPEITSPKNKNKTGTISKQMRHVNFISSGKIILFNLMIKPGRYCLMIAHVWCIFTPITESKCWNLFKVVKFK